MLTRAGVCVCALLAVLLARQARMRRQRAVAWLLCALAAIDLVRPLVLAVPVVPVALLCAWYAATAWGVASVLAPEVRQVRRLGVAVSVKAILATSFAASRLGLTVQLSGAAFLAALAVELYAVTRYALRWEQPDAARIVALVLVCSSLADLAGPWALRQPVRDWYVGQAIAVATWAVVAAVLIGALVRGRLRAREGKRRRDDGPVQR